MTSAVPWILAYCLAFLAGSFPTGLIIGRMHGIDIRAHGSGNIGATNVGRVLGAKAWLQCFSVDLLKGLLPTLAIGWCANILGQWVIPPADAALWLGAMLMPILGHMFCPWLKFKGGKGVAAGLGAILAVFPTLSCAGGLALVVFLVALARWRYVSLGSMLAGLTLPLAVVGQFSTLWLVRDRIFPPPGDFLLTTALVYLGVTLAVAALVIVKHRANIARLRAGTEPKVGQKKPILNTAAPVPSRPAAGERST
jgi:glycerol-3-phosphate acyltransferase PlsY